MNNQFKIFADWLEGLSTGQVKGNKSAKGNTSDQNQNSVRIKPPAFEGRGDPAHFFIKLKNFIDINKIKKEAEKIAVLKNCLSKEALDLFQSLSEDGQMDLEALEKIFKQYFKPMKHDIIETERFLKTRKAKDQSVLNFYIKIKKKGLELLMDPALTKQAFCQGLDKETQKHCALKNAGTIEEYLAAAQEYEKVNQIGGEEKEAAQTLAIDQQAMTLGPEQARFLEESQGAYSVNYSTNNQQNNDARWSNNYRNSGNKPNSSISNNNFSNDQRNGNRNNFNNGNRNNFNNGNRNNFNDGNNQKYNYNNNSNNNRGYSNNRNGNFRRDNRSDNGRFNNNSNPNVGNDYNSQTNNSKQCIGCGRQSHGYERGSREMYCTAWGKICDNCGFRNHISKVCLRRQKPNNQQSRQSDQAGAENNSTRDQTTNWSVRYDKVSMTFDALLGERRTKVLIDTGSFVTLIDDR